MTGPAAESAGPGADAVVFLGPSLPLQEARRLLPGARFCPPARCGDVLAVLRLDPPPARIALIDGVFESVAAVWHKELLLAMQRGCRVYGAASMGALRAAELSEHGMVGIGQIVADYRSGVLVDDDEVAVLHGPAEQRHIVLTDALVNVRATLARAVAEGVLEPESAGRILQAARGTFYQHRRLPELLASLDGAGARALRRWLPAGQVDRKRADALALLEHLAAEGPAPPPRPGPPQEQTAFLRALISHVACRPLPFAADWLPRQERIGRLARLLGPDYLVLRQLTLARAFAEAAGTDGGEGPAAEAEEARIFGCLLREFGLYPAHRAGQSDGAMSVVLLAQLARTWARLDRHLRARGILFEPAAEEVAHHARAFQQERGITTAQELSAWLVANDLPDRRAYGAFLLATMKRARCLHPLAGGLFGFFVLDPSRSWFLETMRQTGLLAQLEAMLADPVAAAAALERRWRALPPRVQESLANACDLDGFAEVEMVLSSLRRHVLPP